MIASTAAKKDLFDLLPCGNVKHSCKLAGVTFQAEGSAFPTLEKTLVRDLMPDLEVTPAQCFSCQHQSSRG
jgi:hypothetical protein